MDVRRKLKDLLDQSGLTEAEIAFYVEVLKNPGNSIFQISRVTKIPKDKAYFVAESLQERGLIDVKNIGKQSKVIAKSLDNYIEKLKNKGRKLNRTADNLKELSNFLPILGTVEDNALIETFSHEEAGERFVDMTYFNWDEIFAYGELDSAIDAITPEADKVFVSRRMKRGGKAFPVLVNPGEYSWENVIGKDDLELRKTKHLYDDKFKNSLVLFSPDAKVTSIWLTGENGRVSGAVIKNSLITKLHQTTFNYLDSIAQYQKFRKSEEKEEV